MREDRIDIIATDHAPHTWEEKNQPFEQAPAGLPLVQHALLTVLELVHRGDLEMTKAVEKIAHNPALRYKVDKRGFLREGYFADLVLVNPNAKETVSHDNVRYLCGWTPFNGVEFNHKIAATYVNGQQVYDGTSLQDMSCALPLQFNR